ncbi:hypothetical protein Cch01nite_12810 [Cellulomonas chitinilytica]|uniref:Lipoprotein n=1 Tax=Cellulomonas chitinilytica TaxID=398759 RepID=A0A919U1J2_9CELL|nr:hypothetical protein [Cellulomonas chitinilytica]GIG20557.1 hypothetical protein Cch01nite_12810 [Cellulomonas chitinilytica]
MRRRPAAVVALVAVTASLLAACSPASPREETTTLGPNEYSRLDAAGIAQIHDTRFARFDVRDGVLLPQDVGLPEGSSGTMVGGASEPELTVELVGPDATETITTRTLDVMTGENGAIIFWRTPEDHDAATAALHDDQTVWGLRAQDVDRWLTETADPTVGQGSRFTRVVGSGVGRSGLVGTVEGSVKDGKETHRVVVELGSALYTPDALETIRSTGSVAGIPAS